MRFGFAPRLKYERGYVMKHKEWILLLIGGVFLGGCGITKNTLFYHEGTKVGFQVKLSPKDTLEPVSVNLGLDRSILAIVPPTCPYKDETAGTDMAKACFKGQPPYSKNEKGEMVLKEPEQVGVHSGEALSVMSIFDLETKTVEGFTIYQNFASGEAANILSNRINLDKAALKTEDLDASFTKLQQALRNISGVVSDDTESNEEDNADSKGGNKKKTSNSITLQGSLADKAVYSNTFSNRGPGGRFGRFGVYEPKTTVAFDNGQENLYYEISLVSTDLNSLLKALKNVKLEKITDKEKLEEILKELKEVVKIFSNDENVVALKSDIKTIKEEVENIKSSAEKVISLSKTALDDVKSLFTRLDPPEYDGIIKGFLKALFGSSFE